MGKKVNKAEPKTDPSKQESPTKADLLKQISVLNDKKAKFNAEFQAKSYDVLKRGTFNETNFFYLLSKIEWQGKEALGVVRINKLLSDVLHSTKKGGMIKLGATAMNALLYLLLRVKSNSKQDAIFYTDDAFPFVSALEEKVTMAKGEYDAAMKPIEAELEPLELRVAELEVAQAPENNHTGDCDCNDNSDCNCKEVNA